MVVQGPRELEGWEPERILIPTTGTIAARHAAEIGFSLARPGAECVLLMKVVEPVTGRYEYREAASEEYRVRQLEQAQEIVVGLAELAQLYDVEAETLVVEGENPEEEILKAAQAEDIDLIVLGTDIRPGSTRLYMGPRVEYVLAQSRCPVVVVNID